MSATEAPSTAPTSESSTQDITFCSEDGLFFQVHRTNLDMHADRFPDADSTTSSPTNPIKLPESGDVLDLLFQYMYRQRQPDLATVPFKVLCGLAHAVEKYRVFPALEICKIHMRDAIPAHPLPVLVYAARYGHITLMDAAARESIGLPLEEVYATLGNDSKVLLAWSRYHAAWLDALQRATTARPPVAQHYYSCTPPAAKLQYLHQHTNSASSFSLDSPPGSAAASIIAPTVSGSAATAAGSPASSPVPAPGAAFAASWLGAAKRRSLGTYFERSDDQAPSPPPSSISSPFSPGTAATSTSGHEQTRLCPTWTQIYALTAHALGGRAAALKDPETVFKPAQVLLARGGVGGGEFGSNRGEGACADCEENVRSWQDTVRAVVLGVTPFSMLLE